MKINFRIVYRDCLCKILKNNLFSSIQYYIDVFHIIVICSRLLCVGKGNSFISLYWSDCDYYNLKSQDCLRENKILSCFETRISWLSTCIILNKSIHIIFLRYCKDENFHAYPISFSPFCLSFFLFLSLHQTYTRFLYFSISAIFIPEKALTWSYFLKYIFLPLSFFKLRSTNNCL